jgi:DNA (cytosine-5)-methyltransferase 1
VNTLNQFDMGDIRTTTLIIFYGNRVADIRIQGDVINTLQARMGTGGNNMPILAYPIQDGREMEKNQNGLGLGAENDPSYTLDQTGAQAVAYSFDSVSSNSMKSSNPDSGCREIDVCKTVDTAALNPSANQGGVAVAYSIREDAKANNFSATEIEQARALQSLQPSVQSHHAQTFIAETVAPTLTAYNMDSRSPQSEEQQRIINSVFSNTMRVRRLTPTECERLQGFPDGWTDEQSDTQRYKQMGNAVTVNVIEWIGSRL